MFQNEISVFATQGLYVWWLVSGYVGFQEIQMITFLFL